MGMNKHKYKRLFAKSLRAEIRGRDVSIYEWMAEVRERDERIRILEAENERLRQMQRLFEGIFPMLHIMLNTASAIYKVSNFFKRRKHEQHT